MQAAERWEEEGRENWGGMLRTGGFIYVLARGERARSTVGTEKAIVLRKAGDLPFWVTTCPKHIRRAASHSERKAAQSSLSAVVILGRTAIVSFQADHLRAARRPRREALGTEQTGRLNDDYTHKVSEVSSTLQRHCFSAWSPRRHATRTKRTMRREQTNHARQSFGKACNTVAANDKDPPPRYSGARPTVHSSLQRRAHQKNASCDHCLTNRGSRTSTSCSNCCTSVLKLS